LNQQNLLCVEVFRGSPGCRDFGSFEFWRPFLKEGIEFNPAVPGVLDVFPLIGELGSNDLRGVDVKAGALEPDDRVPIDASFDDISFVGIKTK